MIYSVKPIIQVKGLSVRLGGQQILTDVNFQILPGELVAIIGPNGSGKTTLLKALLGLVPFSGKAEIFGVPVSKILGKIGYVPQRFSFDKTFPLTVGEFLEMSLLKPKKEKINKALAEVEMVAYQNKLLGELSGGQLQRILIARALLNEPEIVFFDEPTTGIDIEGTRGFYEIISHLNKIHKTTIVMVSHEISVVYKYATKVICLNRDLLCFGKPKETITKEVLKQLYGDEVELKPHHH